MGNPSNRIIICEDHQIVIDGLCSIIEHFPEFEVVDTVNGFSQLYFSLKKNTPNILLLDLNLPHKNGMEVLQELRSKNNEVKVLILTMYNKRTIVNKSINEGANGFLLKNCSSEDLYDALKHVSREESFYYGKGVLKPKKESHQIDDEFYKGIQLTPREKEIIKYLCDGNKVPDIALSMHISPLTVETHKKNIYRKLGVDSSIKLVTFVHENQLL
ncbi:response regulator [Flagellimonas pacifica]|uniref:Two component transcriptional regulator, LuxR family n=1 Tax=Flagellimonas pacifica TaxID=1247520 RepID=A0A285MCZ6_9FLAO|nr:response regulator transcription factor [Allomuricauda parva]SNY94958.1 two component transcriptional regulator, LuxR family [Allomuricauda parva]